ncbi:TonB-dependent receptor [Sandarakinorhabdus sp.]|uniref:TonB-dependent receptor n=1 Tax=Sandarakinorhabdus sp. TaxID=1916663 RepID=UPI003342B657
MNRQISFPLSKFGVFWIATASTLALITATSASARASSADQDQLAQGVAAADAAGDGLAEITVTAQRRETNLQKTPVAITVFSAQDLKNRQVLSLVDLRDGSIPSLRVGQFARRNSALVVCIRGICPASDTNQPARDSTVGIYIDEVYLARPQGLAAALFDLERLEVLRGPQGTLFGRNAIGGALNIVTRKPKGEFGLRFGAGLRNFNGYNGEIHLDLPRIAGIAIKIDAIKQYRDGQVSGVADGQPGFNYFDRQGLAVRARWEPTPALSVDYGFDVARDATTPSYLQLLAVPAVAPGGAPNVAPIVTIGFRRVNRTDVAVPQEPSIGNQFGHRLTVDWQAMENVSLRSISAYRKIDQSQFDNAVGPNTGGYRPNTNFSRYSLANANQDQFSQELQVHGKVGRMDITAGLYYFQESGGDDAWAPNSLVWNATGTGWSRLPSLAAGAENPFPDRASFAEATSYAAYAQVGWRPPILDDRINLTAGARYTHDERNGRLLKVNGIDASNSFTFTADRVDPAFTLEVQPIDNFNVYAKWGQAYRAGGANSRSLLFSSFGPETIQTAEIGAKTEFFNSRVRLNVAAFTSDYTNQQIDFNRNAILQGSLRTVNETVNVPGTSRIRGGEIDLTVNPLDGLTLAASYAYTTWNIPPTVNPFNNAVSQISMVQTPNHAASGAIDYVQPLADAELLLHFDLAYAGSISSGNNVITSPPTGSSVLANARIALTEIDLGTSGAKLEIAIWSRNLFDRDVLTARGFNTATRFETGVYNDPRTFGIDLQVRY